MADDLAGDPAERWNWWNLLLVVLAIWLMASVGTFYLAPLLAGKGAVDLGKTGTFGDTFGAVNSLFSALGVAGVAYALILQFREQRDERESAFEARRDAETNRRHDAELAMTTALINAHAAMMQYRMENYRHSRDMLLNHRDKIDVDQMGNALNEQASKIHDSYRSIEKLSKMAEEKLGITLANGTDVPCNDI